MRLGEALYFCTISSALQRLFSLTVDHRLPNLISIQVSHDQDEKLLRTILPTFIYLPKFRAVSILILPPKRSQLQTLLPTLVCLLQSLE